MTPDKKQEILVTRIYLVLRLMRVQLNTFDGEISDLPQTDDYTYAENSVTSSYNFVFSIRGMFPDTPQSRLALLA